DDPHDDALWAKKYAASKVPASIFTGRTRLYVQAMYGRPLYRYGSDNEVEPANDPAGPVLAALSPPSLALAAFTRADDTHSYPPVTITTSAGVRFDAATGRHWLMIVNGASLTVYPLLSCRAGESARKYLAGAALPDGATLSAADREKLEAFVLAYCRPDVKNAFNVTLGAASSGYAMG